MENWFNCHGDKYKRNAIHNMSDHNNRIGTSWNPHIDASRSSGNYRVLSPAASGETYGERIEEILRTGRKGPVGKNGKLKKLRDNAVLMVTVVVSASSEYMRSLSPADQKRYFTAAAAWLARETGAGNVIDAVVHVDESNPHMHYSYVPLTKDGRLSAKELFNRAFLLKAQEELPRHLQALGFDVKRGERGSQSRNLTTAQMRANGLRVREELARRKEAKELKAEIEHGELVLGLQQARMEVEEEHLCELARQVLDINGRAEVLAKSYEEAIRRNMEAARAAERMRKAEEAKATKARKEREAEEAKATKALKEREAEEAKATEARKEREAEEAKTQAAVDARNSAQARTQEQERKLEVLRQEQVRQQQELEAKRQEQEAMQAETDKLREHADKIKAFLDKRKPQADVMLERNRLVSYLQARKVPGRRIQQIISGEYVERQR